MGTGGGGKLPISWVLHGRRRSYQKNIDLGPMRENIVGYRLETSTSGPDTRLRQAVEKNPFWHLGGIMRRGCGKELQLARKKKKNAAQAIRAAADGA